MNTRSGIVIVMSALLLPGAVAFGRTASNKDLEERANELDARLSTVERANQSLVPMQQKIEAARSELRTLKGQIEEARHDLETLRQQQRDLYADLDRRLLLIEHGATPAGTATGEPPSEADIRNQDEATVYGDSFAALKAGRYEEAIRGFQVYLTKYPDGPRADNASYWLGEAQYVQKDYEAALKAANVRYERYLYPGTQHGFNNDTTPRYDEAAAKAMVPKGRTAADTAKVLRALLEDELDPVLDWHREGIESALRRFAERTGWAPNELFMAVRVAATGRTASPPLFETLAVLGKETTRRRLRRAADALKTGAVR